MTTGGQIVRTTPDSSPDFRTDNTPPLGGVRPPSGSESDEEYEVTWSQSLFRAGVVEGLSRMEYVNGQSHLGVALAAARQSSSLLSDQGRRRE